MCRSQRLNPLDGGLHEVYHLGGCVLGADVPDDRYPFALGAADDERLQPPYLGEVVEVACERPLAAGVPGEEVARVLVLVLDRQDARAHERPLQLRRQEPRNEVDALEDDRPALLERTLDRRVHADEHVARLLEEAGNEGIVRIGDRLAGREARVVDGRHELVREERAQRLPDRVRRGESGDAELVCDLGRDRRLAGTGGAADEDDERTVGHVRASCGSNARTASSSPSATTSFPARTTRRPFASACSATTSIAAALSSMRYVSASTRSSSSRRRSRRARLCDTWTTSASR